MYSKSDSKSTDCLDGCFLSENLILDISNQVFFCCLRSARKSVNSGLKAFYRALSGKIMQSQSYDRIGCIQIPSLHPEDSRLYPHASFVCPPPPPFFHNHLTVFATIVFRSSKYLVDKITCLQFRDTKYLVRFQHYKYLISAHTTAAGFI